MSTIDIDSSVWLPKADAPKPMRRARGKSDARKAYEKMLSGVVCKPVQFDPDHCDLCGDEFSILNNVHTRQAFYTCCTHCIRERARGYGHLREVSVSLDMREAAE